MGGLYSTLEIGRGRFGQKLNLSLVPYISGIQVIPNSLESCSPSFFFQGGRRTGKALIGNNKITMSYPVYPEPEYKLPEDMDLTDIVDLSQIPEELLSLTK